MTSSAALDYPYSHDMCEQARLEQHGGMCREIDQLRAEIERCERHNELLRKANAEMADRLARLTYTPRRASRR